MYRHKYVKYLKKMEKMSGGGNCCTKISELETDTRKLQEIISDVKRYIENKSFIKSFEDNKKSLEDTKKIEDSISKELEELEKNNTGVQYSDDGTSEKSSELKSDLLDGINMEFSSDSVDNNSDEEIKRELENIEKDLESDQKKYLEEIEKKLAAIIDSNSNSDSEKSDEIVSFFEKNICTLKKMLDDEYYCGLRKLYLLLKNFANKSTFGGGNTHSCFKDNTDTCASPPPPHELIPPSQQQTLSTQNESDLKELEEITDKFEKNKITIKNIETQIEISRGKINDQFEKIKNYLDSNFSLLISSLFQNSPDLSNITKNINDIKETISPNIEENNKINIVIQKLLFLKTKFELVKSTGLELRKRIIGKLSGFCKNLRIYQNYIISFQNKKNKMIVLQQHLTAKYDEFWKRLS